MDLERELSSLGAAIDWPATPALRPELAPRRRSLRRPLLVLAALGLVALAAAFAVPRSRGAILRFLHLGGATVAFVDRLPPAQERALGSGIGPRVSQAEARAVLAGRLLLPRLAPRPPLHLAGQVVSVLFRAGGEPVLLSETYTGSAPVLQKAAALGTHALRVRVGGDPGIWLSGRPHVVVFPGAPARVAGNVLLWQHGPLTLRLEGRTLTRARAEELAASLG
jgi:hypothetical protein